MTFTPYSWSGCFIAVRFFMIEDFISRSRWHILIQALLTILSTIVYYACGSFRITRIMAALSKWAWAAPHFDSVMFEALAYLLLGVMITPQIGIVIWALHIHDWHYTIDADEPATDGGFSFAGMSFENCQPLTLLFCLTMLVFEVGRFCLTSLAIHNWVVSITSKRMLVVLLVLLLGYLIFDSFLVPTDTDIIMCVSFLTFSAIPAYYLMYNYYSDLSINLHDYLYGFSNRVMVKAATVNPVMQRWGLLTYFACTVCIFIPNIGYLVASLGLDDHSPFYVAPFISLIDIYVLRKLRASQVRDFGEVVLSYSLVVVPRVLAVFLGTISRTGADGKDIRKTGAWEFVEPLLFLFMMIVQMASIAQAYWTCTDKVRKIEIQQVVKDDRYAAWMATQRDQVSSQRAGLERIDAASVGCFAQCMRRLRDVVLWVNLKTQNKKAKLKDGRQLESWSHAKKLLAHAEKALQEMILLEKDILKHQHRSLQLEVEISENSRDMPKTTDECAEVVSAKERDKHAKKRRIHWFRLLHVWGRYRWVLVQMVVHVVYSVIYWYEMPMINREGTSEFLDLLGLHDVSTARFVVLAWAFWFGSWQYVAFAVNAVVATSEGNDETKEALRQVLYRASCDQVVFKTRWAQCRPRPLSFHHKNAIDACSKHDGRASPNTRVKDMDDIDGSVLYAVKAGKGMLESERPKVAAEASTFLLLKRCQLGLISEWLKSGRVLSVTQFDSFLIRNLKQMKGLTTSSDVKRKYSEALCEATREITLDADVTRVSSDTQQIVQVTTTQLVMSWMVKRMIFDIALVAQFFAEENGGSATQQVAAAINAAAYARSFFSSQNIELPALPDAQREAAKTAAALAGIRLTPLQLKHAALGEAAFLGVERRREVLQIIKDPIRWPNHSGIDKSMNKVLRAELIGWVQACVTLYIKLSLFGGINGVLVSCMFFFSEIRSFSMHEWFNQSNTEITISCIVSSCVPFLWVSFQALYQSWERNNFYFFLTSAQSWRELLTEHQDGVMKFRDTLTVVLGLSTAFMFCILAAALGAFVTTAGIIGYLFAVPIALLTSVLPLVKAIKQRNGAEFHGSILMGGGAIVIAIILIVDLIRGLRGDGAPQTMFASFSIYYLMFLLVLASFRHQMKGWEQNVFLPHTYKLMLIPGFVLWVELIEVLRDQNSRTAWNLFFCGIGAGIALCGFFALAQRRYATSMKHKAFHTETSALSRLTQFLEIDSSEKPTVNEDEPKADKEERRIFGYSALMASLAVCLIGSCCCLMWGYASKHVPSYEWTQPDVKFVVLATTSTVVIVLLLAVSILAGQSDTWSYPSMVLLPTVIPSRVLPDGEFDFSQPLLRHNMPHGCLAVSLALLALLAIVLLWTEEVDLLFNGHQALVGYCTVCASLSVFLITPMVQRLRVAYLIQRNFAYLVTGAHIAISTDMIEQICLSECNKVRKAREEKSKSQRENEPGMQGEEALPRTNREDMLKTCENCFRQCTKKEHANSGYTVDWPVPDSFQKSTLGPKGAFVPEFFEQTLEKMFGPNCEAFTFNEFMVFFKREILQLGLKETFDENFIREFRRDAVRELRTFRVQVTTQFARPSESRFREDTASWAAAQLKRKLNSEIYPEAESRISLVGCKKLKSTKQSGLGALSKLQLFNLLYDNQVHLTYLNEEKFYFEAHFILSVAVGLDFVSAVNDIAFFEMAGGYLSQFGEEVAAETATSMTPANENTVPAERTVHVASVPKWTTPTRFNNLNANAVLATIVTGSDADQTAAYRSKHEETIAVVMREVHGSIRSMYLSFKAISEFLARPCSPSTRSKQTRQNRVHLISDEDWQEVFGRVGPGSDSPNTVMDLFKKIEALYVAWSGLTSSYLKHGTPTAPIAYGVALLLEYYDTDMLVNWYAKLKSLMEVTMSLREYVNNMGEVAWRYQSGDIKANDLNLNDSGASSFRAVGQTVQPATEALDEARNNLMGAKVMPHLGPEVLREAALLLKGQAYFEVVYTKIFGQKVHSSGFFKNGAPICDIQSWAHQVSDYAKHAGTPTDVQASSLWAQFTRVIGKVFKTETILKEEFVQSHPHITAAVEGVRYKLGALCGVNSSHKMFMEFENMLHAVRGHFIKVWAAGDAAEFNRALEQTSAYQVHGAKWFEETANQADSMSDQLFHSESKSYLSRYKHSHDSHQKAITHESFVQMGIVCDSWMTHPVLAKAIERGDLVSHGTKYLKDFISLLTTDRDTQRDYTALTRASQLISMSRTDADLLYSDQRTSSSTASENMESGMDLISKLSSVVGNNMTEERRLQKATRVLYKCTQGEGGSAKLYSQAWAANHNIDQGNASGAIPTMQAPVAAAGLKTDSATSENNPLATPNVVISLDPKPYSVESSKVEGSSTDGALGEDDVIVDVEEDRYSTSNFIALQQDLKSKSNGKKAHSTDGSTTIERQSSTVICDEAVVDVYILDNMIIAVQQMDIPFGEQDEDISLQFAPEAAAVAREINSSIDVPLSPRSSQAVSQRANNKAKGVMRRESLESNQEHDLKDVIMDMLTGLMVLAGTADIRHLHILNKTQLQPEADQALQTVCNRRSTNNPVPQGHREQAWQCLREEKAQASGLLSLQVIRASVDLPLEDLRVHGEGAARSIMLRGFRFLNGLNQAVTCYLSLAHYSEEEHTRIIDVLAEQLKVE